MQVRTCLWIWEILRDHPYADTAIGAEDGSIRDIAIISLVGKPSALRLCQ